MFTNLLEFLNEVFNPFFKLLSKLPPEFTTLLAPLLAFLVILGFKRAVVH